MDRIAVNALQRARNSKDVTQEELAEMSEYSVDSIQAWERGTRTPSIQTLNLLATCLDAGGIPAGAVGGGGACGYDSKLYPR